jgi:hypothetical protein
MLQGAAPACLLLASTHIAVAVAPPPLPPPAAAVVPPPPPPPRAWLLTHQQHTGSATHHPHQPPHPGNMLLLWNRYWSSPQELLPPTQTQCGCLLLLGLPQNTYTRGCTLLLLLLLAHGGGVTYIASPCAHSVGAQQHLIWSGWPQLCFRQQQLPGSLCSQLLPRPVLTADSVGAQQHLIWSGHHPLPPESGQHQLPLLPVLHRVLRPLNSCCLLVLTADSAGAQWHLV